MLYIQDLRGTQDSLDSHVAEIAVKIGDYICFKSDVEQSGKVKSINGNEIIVTSKYGFHGDYIGGSTRTVVYAEDCWVE